MNRCYIVVACIALLVGMTACKTSEPIALEYATVQLHDVFTCRGLDAENRWIGVTDVFMPDQDSTVVVVARLEKLDHDNTIYYELVNPDNRVVFSELRRYPQQDVLGIAFSMPNLMDRGGEGQWKALVTSDGMAIGQTEFYIGEKPEEETEETNFFVIDDTESTDDEGVLDETPEERYSGYIREVTPTVSPSP